MIGRLRGPILEKEPPTLIVEAGGVGYTVDAPLSTVYHLPAVGEEVNLRIHTVVREDAIQLYGFLTAEEQRLFVALLRVTGVGAKLALQVLSGLPPAELWRCIQEEDLKRMSSVPGIGKKTAQRLVMELRDTLSAPGDFAPPGAAVEGGSTPAGGPRQEAVAALQELGYSGEKAEQAVAGVAEEGLTVEELLKRSLQNMAR
ncbi:Holliday junction branch migration protein RuvA [Thiohalorhabdus methylotrophus]|uniref:Holliday junction branch migration complex subunit RuvA n=1 Tax=Thiohalorhabdus methylotrophus TaxID=3242694 RepID=A0ABV4TR76_9GAMM